MPRAGSTIINSGTKKKNYVINGQFDFFQRKSTPSWIDEGDRYTADRWYRFKQGGGGTGVFTNIQDAGLNDGTRSLKFGRTNGSSDVNQTEIIQALESKDSVELSGKKVTFSFKIRKGADFSGTEVNFYISYGTGTDQGVVSAWTGSGAISAPSIPEADLDESDYYQAKSTTTLPTINQLRFDINYVPTGTAGANDWIEITEVMLNEGEFTNYSRHGGTYDEELLACQRYYELSSTIQNGYTAQYSPAPANTFFGQGMPWATEKRISLSAGLFSVDVGNYYWVHAAVAPFSAIDSTGTVVFATKTSWALRQPRVVGGSTPTQGNIYILEAGFTVFGEAEL